LRDYRFYKNDMVHPNEAAINFVFEKFCESVLDVESTKIMKEIKDIIKAINHKPFFNESEAHQKFIAAQLKNISSIERDYPFIDLSKERKHFHNLF
jgi:hypothetical protein